MANSFKYKTEIFGIGDTVSITYSLKEGDKTRRQIFKGVLIGVKGQSEANRMFTVRKMSKTGIGIEKIIPVLSPNIVEMKIVKKSPYRKAKAYFIRDISEQELRRKLYRQK